MTKIHDPSMLDWNLTDTVLARQNNVSRERIRQLRKALGKPQHSKQHSHQLPYKTEIDAIKNWLNSNDIKNLYFSDILTKIKQNVKLSLSICTVGKIIRKHGGYNKTRKPADYSHINWNLIDTDIQKLWNLKNAALVRIRKNISQSTWKKKRNRGLDPNYQTLINEELKKVQNDGK